MVWELEGQSDKHKHLLQYIMIKFLPHNLGA